MIKGQKGFVQQLLPAVVIPVLLIVFVSVISNFQTYSAQNFKALVTNETNTTGGVAGLFHTTTYDCPEDDKTNVIVRVDNESKTMTDIHYNLTWGGFDVGCRIGFLPNVTGHVNITYYGLGYGDQVDSYASFTDINSGTWDGFGLAALLPYVIIAMIILGIIVAAIVFRL
jgi:hypothetical protein